MRRKLYLLPLLASFALIGCLRWRHSDTELGRIFTHAGVPIAIHHIGTAARPLRYVEVRPDSPGMSADTARANILFIHGAPSSLRVWESYLLDSALLRRANLYAVDRPGYGHSGFGHADTSIVSQALALRPILERHPGRWVLFGSSYGGPIAAVLAALEPARVQAILFTSPSLAPSRERIYGISYIIRRRAFGWFFPTIFRMANAEKLSHRHQLTLASGFYGQVRQPITYMRGTADDLIWPSNATYADSAFTTTSIRHIPLAERPHFFTFSEQPRIIGELIRLVELRGGATP